MSQLVLGETRGPQQILDLPGQKIPSGNPFHDVDLWGRERGRRGACGRRGAYGDVIGQMVHLEPHRVQQGIDVVFGHLVSKNPFHDVDLSGTKRGRRQVPGRVPDGRHAGHVRSRERQIGRDAYPGRRGRGDAREVHGPLQGIPYPRRRDEGGPSDAYRQRRGVPFQTFR